MGISVKEVIIRKFEAYMLSDELACKSRDKDIVG